VQVANTSPVRDQNGVASPSTRGNAGQSDIQHLTALLDISQALASTLDLTSALHRVLEKLERDRKSVV